VNQSAKIAILCVAATLAACSSMETERIDYRSTGKGPSLDVPPDLTQLSRDNRYAIPGGTVTASGYLSAAPVQGPAIAAASSGDVRIERLGNQRWLVVDRNADRLWQPLKDFWVENGFVLVLDQPDLGLMETEWAENRAKLPQDFIRKAIGTMLDSLYSTGERDKFRTRIERTPAGATEIYISHRGMVEVYSSGSKDTTVWQPRPADPELEAEFLRRLMVKLGVPQAKAQAVVAGAAAPKAVASVTTINGLPGLEIADGFDRAWRRVGLALDRSGFTVEDRDRSQGTYFVRYVPSGDKKEGNFFSKLFSGGDSAAALQKFRVVLKSEGDKTTLTVASAAASATPETTANAQRIVKLIADDLK
jgi:outer membrane protein assembly factor BamC